MDELYDWAKEEDRFRNPQVREAPLVPRITLPPVYRYDAPPANVYHGASCQCHECFPVQHQRAPLVNHPNAGAPLLDKVVALVVAFAAMVVGGLVLTPVLVPLLGMLALMMLIVVVGLTVVMGIIWAITGYRPGNVRTRR